MDRPLLKGIIIPELGVMRMWDWGSYRRGACESHIWAISHILPADCGCDF